MDVKDLGLSIRAFNMVCRAGIKTVPELYGKYKSEMSWLISNIGMKAVAELSDIFEARNAEIMAEVEKAKQTPAEISPPSAVVLENPEAHARAYCLLNDTKSRLALIEENYYAVCQNIKEMRDGKLYKELGYKSLEDCCNTEFGIKRAQAYKYISIAERLPEDFVQSTRQIGTEKLSLIAMLEEPDLETITETVDLESVTVKELKAKIKALTDERTKRCSEITNLQTKVSTLERQKANLESQSADLGQQLDALKETAQKEKKRSETLEKQVEELENRPVDHICVPSPDQSREVEILKGTIRNMEKESTETVQKMRKEHEASVKELKNKVVDLEYELERAQNANDDKTEEGRFWAWMDRFQDAVDALEEFIGEDVEDDKKKAKFLSIVDRYYRKNLLYLVPSVGKDTDTAV